MAALLALRRCATAGLLRPRTTAPLARPGLFAALSSAAGPAAIFEVTESNFKDSVAESPVPVLLDCYADWCRPCKELTPRLERLVTERQGTVRLAKLNVDAHPQLAGSLGVQQMPTVFGVAGGRLVSRFLGAIPDPQLNAFIDELLKAGGGQAEADAKDKAEEEAAATPAGAEDAEEPTEEDDALLDADAAMAAAESSLVAGGESLARAQRLFHRMVSDGGNDVVRGVALAGLARVLLAQDKMDDIAAMIGQARVEITGPTKELLALFDEHKEAASLSRDDLAARKASLDEPESRFVYALGCIAQSQNEEALEQGFLLVRKHRQWNEQAGRRLLIAVFDILGPGHPLVAPGRRRFTSLWNC